MSRAADFVWKDGDVVVLPPKPKKPKGKKR